MYRARILYATHKTASATPIAKKPRLVFAMFSRYTRAMGFPATFIFGGLAVRRYVYNRAVTTLIYGLFSWLLRCGYYVK